MSILKVGEIKHESFTGTTQLKLDSAGRLLVGTTTEGAANADDLTVATSGTTGITIRSGSSNSGNIYFSDATSGTGEAAGAIEYSHSDNRMSFFTTTGTERMRIDSSGNVGVGVIPKSGQYSGYNHLQVGESATLSSNDTQGDTNTTNLTQNAYLNSNASAWKYLHTDEASKYEQSQGYHSFQVAASGSADATISFSNRLRIDSDGLKFGTDTAAANALDDYEEGTFTPSFANVDNSVITVAHYNYTKVGRLVHINARFDIGSNNDGSRFGFQLPFTQAGSRRNVLSAISTRSGTNTAPFAFIIDTNQSYAYANELDGFGDSQTAYATFAGDKIFVTGTYESN